MKTSSPPTSNVIAIDQLSCYFGKKAALQNVTLHVPTGSVFGLVGENGAGKTTLLNHVLGCLSPHEGTVRVFDRDPIVDAVHVLGRLGYLSELRDFPGWMTVQEILRYTQAFYPQWDPHYAESMRRDFKLSLSAKISHLSRGEAAKLGLLLSRAHRPELLVLDEPSSGLDPVVRKDILETIIRMVSEEGRTVLFSSHLLHEVERVCDWVAMLSNGRILLQGRLHEIMEAHRRLIVRFPQSLRTSPSLAGSLASSGAGREWSFLCNGDRSLLEAEAKKLGGEVVEEFPASLEEIFVARISSIPASNP